MPAVKTAKKTSSNGRSAAASVQRLSKHQVEVLLERNLPILTESNTFAKMLEADLSVLPNLRDLRWLFPTVCRRKHQAALSATEQERYLCAFEMINNDGTLGQLVDIHAQMHMQHTNERLLPWHRIFVYLFEEALHNYHPDVCVPCWDWTSAGEQHFPGWLASVLPTVHTPTRTITVVRSPGTDAQLASIAAGVPSAMAQTSYNSFTAPINGIHGAVHIWVGGTMSNVSEAAADPVFWLHHGNLDRLWWVWYNSSAGHHQNPALTGSEAVMDPWSYTEPQTRDIGALGYEYV
jgi:tyrosinase